MSGFAMSAENRQHLERNIEDGENEPVMFRRGDGEHDGWLLTLKSPQYRAVILPPDSDGWSLDVDEGSTTATIGCDTERDHANVTWVDDPEAEPLFHTFIRGGLTRCGSDGGGAGGSGSGNVGQGLTFEMEILDGLVYLVEKVNSTGIGVAVKISAFTRQRGDSGEPKIVPVEVMWACEDNDLVFLESVPDDDSDEDGATMPGDVLDSDDLRQTAVYVKSDVEDTYTVVATVDAYEGYFESVPPYDLHAVVHVYDIALVVDANRDLKINAEDVGLITGENPWRFWYNDDQDFKAPNAVSEFNEPGKGPEESDYHKYLVDGESVNVNVRDLTDFYPLLIDINHHLEATMDEGSLTTGYRVKIVKSENENPSQTLDGQVVFTNIQANESGTYISDVDTAESLSGTAIDNIYRDYNQFGGADQIIISESRRGSDVMGEFIENLIDDKNPIILVQHYKGSGLLDENTALFLEVYDESFDIITKYLLPIKVGHVEKMFSHIDLSGKTNNDDGYVSKSRYIDSEPVNYPDSLTNNTQFVFVHGYNNNMQASRGAKAENFKRLHLLGSKSKYIAVSWHGWESQWGTIDISWIGYKAFDYQINVYNAFKTSFWLEDALSNFYVSSDKTYIMAHSLGNVVVSSMIEDNWNDNDIKAEKYFMVNAAVPSESYSLGATDVHEDMIPKTWEDEWDTAQDFDRTQWKRIFAFSWNEFFNDDDPRNKIKWRGRFDNVRKRVDLFNFWSKGDRVFWRIPHSTSTMERPPLNSWFTWTKLQWADWIWDTYGPMWFGVRSWARQERLKGVGPKFFYTDFGGWSKNPFWEILENPWIWAAPENQAAENPYWGVDGVFPEKYGTGNFPSVLTDPTPANNLYFRDAMLAAVIPAMNLAAGGKEDVPGVPHSNVVELESGAVSGWPVDGYEDDLDETAHFWDHGHFQIIALPYVYHFYNRITDEINE